MSKTEINVDSSQVEKLFAALTGNERHKAIMGALRASSNILKVEAERRFKAWKSPITGATINYGAALRVKRRQKNGKVVEKIKRVATVILDKREKSAKVHIMADYRVKWFEMGTRGRTTLSHKIIDWTRGRGKGVPRSGKGGYRGRIEGSRFFRTAQQLTERRIFGNMQDEMAKSIIRIAKKYGRT